MIRFLLKRPIATSMAFVALFLLGLVSYQQLPVSLLPDIAIPEITIKAQYSEYTAREMENRLSRLVRRSVQQVTGLKDIKSESHNSQATIRLLFEHGVDVDLAAIEVNERIDRFSQWLPDDMDRPTVIKASASDIPVFFINMSQKDETDQHADFLELSRFSEQVIKKRLEQITEVGFVDVSGTDYPQVSIVPNMEKLKAYDITLQNLETVISSHNFTIGNIIVNEGHYQYHVRVATPMVSIQEVQDIRLPVKGRIMQLKELANIELTPQKKTGFFMDGSQKAISMAVIKQADAKMQNLKAALDEEVKRITKAYPSIQFDITQDQTQLLDYAITNLKQTLIFGAFLAFIVLFLFIPNWRLPLLMGITVPISLVISVLFLMLFGISINIISLSGLVLGIGLMIDNSIIVLDNISQHRDGKKSLFEACADATNEVFRPLLSSALTTSAVFIPLVFMSGISGALFYDQAITVTVALLVSFLVSVTLLPVIFHLIHRKSSRQQALQDQKKGFIVKIIQLYEWGLDSIFKRKALSTFLFCLLIPVSYFLFTQIKKESFPSMHQQALMIDVTWNEGLSNEELATRVRLLHQTLGTQVSQMNAWCGTQDYIMNNEYNLLKDQSRMYLNCSSSPDEVQQHVTKHFETRYPEAEIEFSEPQNIFTKTFVHAKAPMVMKLYLQDREIENDSILKAIDSIDLLLSRRHLNPLGQYTFINLTYDREKLMLYDVSLNSLLRTMKVAFSENEIGTLNTSYEAIPIVLGAQSASLDLILKETRVRTNAGHRVPITHFLSTQNAIDFEVVYGDKEGVYIPAQYNASNDERSTIESKASRYMADAGLPFHIKWEGSLYDFDNDIREIAIVLSLSVLLLYFILAIQFESLLQPLIILLEIPMDLSGALLVLMFFGSSLNIMSAIGIVVMTGIIINDSILKLDTINSLYRSEKMSLFEAIKVGGERRIRPILMTSVTTILALAPFVFGEGLGAELQLPLALAVIGGLGLGTIVSLYFIPLCYWWLNVRKENNRNA